MKTCKFGYYKKKDKWIADLDGELHTFDSWDEVIQWGKDNKLFMMRIETAEED